MLHLHIFFLPCLAEMLDAETGWPPPCRQWQDSTPCFTAVSLVAESHDGAVLLTRTGALPAEPKAFE